MMTRKPTFSHGAGLKHHSHSGHGNRGGSVGTKVPAMLWSHMGPSTLLLAPTGQGHPHPHAHQIQLPRGARKIVNPVTVNALKSLGVRCSGMNNSFQGGGGGCTLGISCCSCCYCCCEVGPVDKPPSSVFRLNNHKHSNNQRNSRLSTASEKPRRRKSRDKLSHQAHHNGVTPFRCSGMDVRNLIDVWFDFFNVFISDFLNLKCSGVLVVNTLLAYCRLRLTTIFRFR